MNLRSGVGVLGVTCVSFVCREDPIKSYRVKDLVRGFDLQLWLSSSGIIGGY